MKRHLFTALSVPSLLLCLATLALWVRSYWRYDSADYVRDAVGWVSLHNLYGLVQVTVIEAGTYESSVPRGFWRLSGPLPNYRLGRGPLFGFHYLHSKNVRVVTIPHWSLALLFAILPALHLRAAIRSRRLHRIGHCPRCGYDLRATPQRCPECGAVPAEAAAR
jgi:hypothetical protein